jgi:hypothetical protein
VLKFGSLGTTTQASFVAEQFKKQAGKGMPNTHPQGGEPNSQSRTSPTTKPWISPAPSATRKNRCLAHGGAQCMTMR